MSKTASDMLSTDPKSIITGLLAAVGLTAIVAVVIIIIAAVFGFL